MMKTAKSSMKSRKSPPMGKGSPLKKPVHSGSPYGVLGSTRPTKHLPGMKSVQKRLPSPPLRMRRVSMSPPPRRSMSHRSSNPGSPVSMDRLRSVKRPKLEKRKPSPPMSSSSRGDFERISPYLEKYSRPSSTHPPPHFQPQVKKMHRDDDRYRSPSPPCSRSGAPRTESHSSRPVPPAHRRREEPPYEVHLRSRSSSSVAPKVVPGKSYAEGKRFREESPRDRYVTPVEKSYAPTLHERFSSCADSTRNEPRVRYSTQDLEKITIDIHRNIREDHSPTLRRIVDPADVKLVRRVDEGHRPIFDREEIKQAPRDLREDAYFERKLMSYGGPTRNMGEVENYEITRHRFDPHHSTSAGGSGRSLSDRWQDPYSKKDASGMDREERDLDYERGPPARSFRPRPGSAGVSDLDYRSDRYSAEAAPGRRPNYRTARHRSQERDVVPMPGKEVSGRGHRVQSVRREGPPLDDERPHYRPERRYSGPKDRNQGGRPEHSEWHPRDRSHSGDHRLPDYPRRNDKYSYRPSWEEKMDGPPPRSSGYYDHEGRDGSDSYRGRGNSRTFRSHRGFRSRGGYRPLTRGGGDYRGSSVRSFRGGSGGPRGGRNGVPRRGRFSPGLWEHDLYSRSPDRKMGP